MTSEISYLWEIVGTSLKGRLKDNWMLARTYNPKNAHFVQLGLGGINMRCSFTPRSEKEIGEASVQMCLRPNDTQTIAGFIKEDPAALLSAPLTHQLLLVDQDGKTFDPVADESEEWDKDGMLIAKANVVSPCSLDLFVRIGPWFVDSLQGNYNLMTRASVWSKNKPKRYHRL